MGTRDYNFLTGPQTEDLPAASAPVGDDDIVRKQDLDGVETDAAAALALHVADTSTHGVGVVVGTTETQDVSAKTFTDAVQLTEIATPATPTAGKMKVYPKTDGKLYKMGPTGVESEVGSGAGGSSDLNPEYIGNPGAEIDALSWTVYKNTTAGTSPDNFGGTPSGSVTWTRNTTAPLGGDADFLLTKDAANRQGEGVYYEFTLENADKAKVLILQGLATTSANYADDDVRFSLVSSSDSFVADFNYIEGSPADLLAGTAGDWLCEAQTDASDTAYRFCIHIASTNATAYTVNFDRISVKKGSKSIGSIKTDPVAYSPTVAGLGAGSGTTTAYWHRDGAEAVLDIRFVKDGTPGSGSTLVSFTVPSGITLDTARCNTANIGFGSLETASFNGGYTAVYNAGTVLLRKQGTSGNVTGADLSNGYEMKIQARFAVTGWSSSTVMSSDASTRVVSMLTKSGPSGTPTGSLAVVKYGAPAAGADTHGQYSASTGLYTIVVPGKYNVSAGLRINGTFTTGTSYSNIAIYKTGSSYIDTIDPAVPLGSNYPKIAVDGIDCVAGDTIGIYVSNNGSGLSYDTVQSWFSVSKQAGPSQIAASEKIKAGISVTTTTLGVDTATKVVFTTVDYDSHGAIDVGKDDFVAQRADLISVKAFLLGPSTANTAGNGFSIYAYKNGSLYKRFALDVANTTATYRQAASGTIDVPVNAGDTLSIYAQHVVGGQLAEGFATFSSQG